jgi:hypothetical protein
MNARSLKRIAVAAAVTGGFVIAAVAEEGPGDGRVPLRDAAVVEIAGVAAAIAAGPPDGVRLAFSKGDEDRRLLAVRLPRPALAAGSRSLLAECRLQADGPCAARFAVVALEGEAVWGKVAAAPLAPDMSVTTGMPLDSLRPTSFAPDPDGRLDLARVQELWVGVAIDGAASGTLELSSVRVSAEPYRASEPLEVPFAEEALWECGADPAVQYGIRKGAPPGGGDAIRISFTFPGGRHMYIVPRIPAPLADLVTYGALEISYRAELPAGIGGLLVALDEAGGAQYYADPAPPARADFTTVTIPFADLKLGSWSRDSNGRLDPGEVRSIVIGAHGTARGEGGEGRIEIARICFTP